MLCEKLLWVCKYSPQNFILIICIHSFEQKTDSPLYGIFLLSSSVLRTTARGYVFRRHLAWGILFWEEEKKCNLRAYRKKYCFSKKYIWSDIIHFSMRLECNLCPCHVCTTSARCPRLDPWLLSPPSLSPLPVINLMDRKGADTAGRVHNVFVTARMSWGLGEFPLYMHTLPVQLTLPWIPMFTTRLKVLHYVTRTVAAS